MMQLSTSSYEVGCRVLMRQQQVEKFVTDLEEPGPADMQVRKGCGCFYLLYILLWKTQELQFVFFLIVL